MYNKEVFFGILSLHKVTNKALSSAIGVSSGNISDWKSGKSKPNIDAITKIADYLDCSVDYLLGRTDDLRQNTAPPALTGVSDQESRLLAAFRSLDPVEQGIEIGRLERMVEEKDS